MMTVREMIEFLSQFDGNDEVVVSYDEWDDEQMVRVFKNDDVMGEVHWVDEEV